MRVVRGESATWVIVVHDGREAIVDGHCEVEDLKKKPPADVLVNPKAGIVDRC